MPDLLENAGQALPDLTIRAQGGFPMSDLIDRARLFAGIRRPVFGGKLRQKQVDGINRILDAWDNSPLEDLRWLAYMLGTAYHETASTMQPIREYGTPAYFTRLYDVRGKRPEVARRMGNTEPGDGIRYCGRGYVQLTWKINYQRASRLVGVDLVANPDLAMDPDIAARIMFEGMTEIEIVFEDKTSLDPGWTFTGRCLEDYFNDAAEDWTGARKIINGTDHAWLIAETALDFYAALDYRAEAAA